MRALFAILLAFSLLLSSLPGLAETALDETQKNSIAMLNYLAMLTQEINASKNSRLYLEQAYSSLVNNINPNAIDELTLEYLNSLLDILEGYRMASVKRERIQYVLEQERAKAFRSALPNPLNVLSVVESRSLPALAFTVVNLAADVYANYTNANEVAEFEYLKEGWSLDDEASARLHESRKNAFSYMVMIVNDYGLPGELALNESAIQEFVTRKGGSNNIQRIQYLEANKSTYKAMGEYWLSLAESYYLQGEYLKCLEAINEYGNTETRIFRKDYGLASVLPMTIAAAAECLQENEYIQYAEASCETILKNIDNDEWALRYFVAQTHVNLYALTKNESNLRKAYDITLNNVNYLTSKQQSMNREYLADVVTAPVPKGATKDTKNQIDSYNKLIKEERKAALAPVYEPLLLNCELLFFLSDELKISDSEKAKINGILHENGESLFLVPAIDSKFNFTPLDAEASVQSIEVTGDGKEITLPINILTKDTRILLSVTEDGSAEPQIFEDWTVSRVDRKEKGNYSSFIAVFTSPQAKAYKYGVGANVKIEVIPRPGMDLQTYTYHYVTRKTETQWWEAVKVWDDGIDFIRAEE